MYCPMKFNQIAGHSEGFGPAMDDLSNKCICEKEQCAWWTYNSGDQGYCAITRIAIEINAEIVIDNNPDSD